MYQSQSWSDLILVTVALKSYTSNLLSWLKLEKLLQLNEYNCTLCTKSREKDKKEQYNTEQDKKVKLTKKL